MSPSQSRYCTICLACLTLAACGRSIHGMTIQDESLGFTLVLPDEFREFSVEASPDIVHAAIHGDENDDLPDLYVFVERMHGVIGRGTPKREDLPADFAGSVFTVKWQDYDINVFEIPEESDGVAFVTYNAQIPLKREAIQLKLFGPRDRRAELSTLLAQIVSGCRGETNWSAPTGRRGDGRPSPTALIIAVIVMVLALLLLLMWVSRHVSPRVTLVLAVVIYAFGWANREDRTREALLISGVCRLAGFTGIILAILDGFAQRRKRRKAARARKLAASNSVESSTPCVDSAYSLAENGQNDRTTENTETEIARIEPDNTK
jgi:hypothetical protein